MPQNSTTIFTFPVKENSSFVFSYLLPKNSVFSLELRKNFPKNLAGLQIVLSLLDYNLYNGISSIER
jgi:hypothetical protein